MSTPVVKSSDMPEELQSKVFELSLIAVKKFTVEKEIANYLKKEMDALCGPMWHCIVGKNFGSYVTHAYAKEVVVQKQGTPQGRKLRIIHST